MDRLLEFAYRDQRTTSKLRLWLLYYPRKAAVAASDYLLRRKISCA